MQLVDTNAAQRRKSHYQLGVLDKGATYLDSLNSLGLRCCVVCVLWCDVGGGVAGGCGLQGREGLVKACIFHNQKMHLYLII